MTIDRIPLAEYAARRRKVLAGLKGAAAMLVAGPRAGEGGSFRPHAHFEYLTGVIDEPEAVLLLDPGNPVEARRSMLFLAPLDPERARWDGYRMEINKALRDRTGFESVFRSDVLPRALNAAAARSRRLACLHPPAAYTQPVTPDLAIFRKVADRLPGVTIEDRSDLLEKMRAVKSRNEVALIERAVAITAAGFQAVFQAIRPGLNEFDVQETIEHAYRTGGARGAAFPTIAGSGHNSTVLHYRANDQVLAEGDLICIDSGAFFGGYSADVTRTIPVGGSYTARQREVYEVVLKAQQAAIAAVKPGVTLAQVDGAARKVITAAGYGDYFIHNIGHHLGLQTHDVAPDEPLRQGAVVTVEPGIYIPQESIGIRIEDDVLVTADGARNLSARIPSTVADVERAFPKMGLRDL